MKSTFFLAFIIIFSNILLPQGKVAIEIGELIQAGKIKEAEEKVNYYLKEDPNNVDALMMKGNIILNRDNELENAVRIDVNGNESIYEDAVGFISGNDTRIIPGRLAIEVADIWKHALSIDNSREDIHFGICELYSEALLTNELISYLPTLKKTINTHGELHYSMCNYARNIIDRGNFDKGMEVYKTIFSLYPQQSGLLSDIAGEYYSHGNFDSAYSYITCALKGQEPDSMSYMNAFIIFSMMGKYHEALAAITRYSRLNHNTEYLFYEGLLNYLENKPAWKSLLASYCSDSSNGMHKSIAQILISENYKESLDDYQKIIEPEYFDAYKVLIHQKFMNTGVDKFIPWFNYAETLTRTKFFAKAADEFLKLENSGLISGKEEEETIAICYGWTLWNLGKKQESLSKWSRLLNSDNFYYKSAGSYFTGKYYLENNDKGKAREYFRMVSGNADKSKYAMYCYNLLNKM